MTFGSMTGFADTAMEDRFRASERRALMPYIRGYAAVLTVALLAYTLVNPLFFGQEGALHFAILIATSLTVLGGYTALTFWPRYSDHPVIDFACLLALVMLVSADNFLLLRNLSSIGLASNAPVQFSSFLVTAFAAIALAGRLPRFLLWLACHGAFFTLMTVTADIPPAQLVFVALSHGTNLAVVLLINWMLGRQHRATFALREALDAERGRNEELLYNVLPQVAAERIKAGLIVADSFSDASVVFIDVVGFSALAKRISPGHLIEVLNGFFSLADRCAADHGVEKVKTIGDAYLAMAGGTLATPNSADAAIAFADAVIAGLAEVRAATGIPISVRVGIHSGPVVGGVIGATRMAYDYWGETLNIAARIEGSALPDGIAVSESTWLRCHARDRFGLPERMLLKGVGEMAVFRTLDADTTETRLIA